MKKYNTVAREGVGEFILRKSRFIGHISPVTSEEEAQSFIEKIKTEHWQATHNCWAYILKDYLVQRYSDDGEPQGTAGIPILEVIKKEELSDIVIVVTRYFGGVMLGAGGLIRAYSQGAKIAIDAGGRVAMTPCHIVRFTLPYPIYNIFLSAASDLPIKILDSSFGEDVTIELRIFSDYLEKLTATLTRISSGNISPEIIGETFAPDIEVNYDNS